MRLTLLKIKEYFEKELEHNLLLTEIEQKITIERWRFLEIYENHSSQYPSIEVLPSETKIDYGSPHKPIVEGLPQFDIDIDISVAGTDPEAINNTVMGYESAIKKMVKDDETFGGRFLWVYIRGIPFSPMIKEGRAGMALKILTVGFTVRNPQ